ncbi:hypothetical protein EIN_462550 [Entamoeba invadens IP1]|uniref:Uncharacterized protein n=1 Tax=Entamoeba invadens IP1 TaxID=370355 RepID=A0A0A1UC93_ENTIV|nr:hypothetical protein EIN_462550 [Entamoeba invadens IP1]ELP89889.1 hypothetical protein EIN_462550 [Entamoeba invadens IP1]|eukprot:XP_004256660.1 hypothetical protein EIN_462550 [Entamoeba invadens IP1]
MIIYNIFIVNFCILLARIIFNKEKIKQNCKTKNRKVKPFITTFTKTNFKTIKQMLLIRALALLITFFPLFVRTFPLKSSCSCTYSETEGTCTTTENSCDYFVSVNITMEGIQSHNSLTISSNVAVTCTGKCLFYTLKILNDCSLTVKGYLVFFDIKMSGTAKIYSEGTLYFSRSFTGDLLEAFPIDISESGSLKFDSVLSINITPQQSGNWTKSNYDCFDLAKTNDCSSIQLMTDTIMCGAKLKTDTGLLGGVRGDTVLRFCSNNGLTNYFDEKYRCRMTGKNYKPQNFLDQLCPCTQKSQKCYLELQKLFYEQFDFQNEDVIMDVIIRESGGYLNLKSVQQVSFLCANCNFWMSTKSVEEIDLMGEIELNFTTKGMANFFYNDSLYPQLVIEGMNEANLVLKSKNNSYFDIMSKSVEQLTIESDKEVLVNMRELPTELNVRTNLTIIEQNVENDNCSATRYINGTGKCILYNKNVDAFYEIVESKSENCDIEERYYINKTMKRCIKCVDGYRENIGSCIAFPQCNFSEKNMCKKCALNFAQNFTSNFCHLFNISFCKISSNKMCLECEENKYLRENTCQTVPNSSKIIFNQIICENGFYISNFSCQKCTTLFPNLYQMCSTLFSTKKHDMFYSAWVHF